MAFELVFPPDTQSEIDEFLSSHYLSAAEAYEALATLERETANIAANPHIGAVPWHGPFEKRRIYRFAIRTSTDGPVEAEFAYVVRELTRKIVLVGFRRL